MTCCIRPNASRQEVTAAVTRVSLSLCRMLEDDLKISSDEEEAEQQVSDKPKARGTALSPIYRTPHTHTSTGTPGLEML
ncbi:hypothetical protein INR49_028497 [Caranx melampygus]|nr:hypothetical protein INR49_028497 [Caranx melampygus]